MSIKTPTRALELTQFSITMKRSPSAPLLSLHKRRNSSDSLPDTLRRKTPKTKLFFILLFLLCFAFFSLSSSRDFLSSATTDLRLFPTNISTTTAQSFNNAFLNLVLRQQLNDVTSLRVSSIQDSVEYKTLSVLLPGWEVLTILSPETPLLSSDSLDGFHCLFSTNKSSPARFSGVLPFTNRTMFKCDMPRRVRHLRPFLQPTLTKRLNKEFLDGGFPAKEMIRSTFFVYESLSTENDVVLFVKGLNNRQGLNRSPNEFRCVFGEDDGTTAAVRTPVTSSIQEIFRCHKPDLTDIRYGAVNLPAQLIKVSLEITNEDRMFPSVAYYTPPPKITNKAEGKLLLCACTMVNNVAKYLKEWVMYHSKIGVQKFILYDNDSNDGLHSVVNDLNEEGYNVTTLLWIWPKTQEAGFSHSALHAKHSCMWMMYLDVDEFVYAPSWDKSLLPSNRMLTSLLPIKDPSIGQISLTCNDFGPSGQNSHPVEGVTQGYNCHTKVDEQRHKSVVLLEAIDVSLANVVHHFVLNKSFKWKQVSTEVAVVNHYKYQAWSEFKAKFKRRVSTYVADWKETVNPRSKDRTPGLGFEPVEPKGWSQMFCDLRDERLKILTKRWFGSETENGLRMAWQR